jgi:hypothetical protein
LRLSEVGAFPGLRVETLGHPASDEDYIALHGAADDTWYTVMEQNTGMAIRTKV